MSGSTSQIPLQKWIDDAIDTVDTSDADLLLALGADPKSLALTSDQFLSSALKVAWSLADYISRAENQLNSDRLCVLPTPGTDWAHNIIVNLSSSSNEDLQKVSEETFSEDMSPALEGSKYRNPYISATSAQFSPTFRNDSGCNSLISKTQRIYSLGIVFYEIFSGGERPVQEQLNVNGAIDFDKKLGISDESSGSNDLCESANSDSFEEGRDAKRASIQVTDRASASVSIEPLLAKGLPGPLCDLIANMIDCINGDTSGDETYCQTSDIASDLQLMMDKPRKFLHGIDLEKNSVTDLKLNESIFGKETKLAALQDSYRSSISGESQLAIITGQPGTGKSSLAYRLGSYITMSGGVFLSSKFDVLQKTQSFSAVALAFNQYVRVLIEAGNTTLTSKLASKLRMAMGSDVFLLARVVPNVRCIISEDVGEHRHDQYQDMRNGQNKMMFMLCQFVEVISSSTDAPITLFLDDLQWADMASIEFIKHLLLNSGELAAKQFFFLGCYRDELSTHQIPFLELSNFGVVTTTVELEGMGEGMVNTVISEMLCLSPRLTKSLSNIIYHKTKGNPHFFSQLMLSLSKDGLLRLSLSRRRWEWDESKIESLEMPDDVAILYISTIKRLPTDVQSALCVLSCFGAGCEYAILRVLELKLALHLIQPMKVAASEGLVVEKDSTIQFGHKKIQNASYNLMSTEERPLLHFKYGVALCAVDNNGSDEKEKMLFAGVSQVNRGGASAVVEKAQFVILATLNLVVGNKAVEMSDFVSAQSFFDHGISFLRRGHWQTHYDLSLALFNGVGKCAFAIGDHISYKIASDQVLTFARSFEDKLEILYLSITALTAASRLSEAIEKGLTVLSQLGECMPDVVSDTELKSYLNQTKIMLNDLTDAQLVNYRIMSDPLKTIAMKFYVKLELTTQFGRPAAQPIITLKMINLSITHGMSSASPIGFVYYGMLLARLGDLTEGYRYVKIAHKLLDKVGLHASAGEVIAFGTQVMCYVEPVQATNELHCAGYSAAMKVGDTQNAMLNNSLHDSTAFWMGTKLKLVKEMFEKTRRQMKQYNQFNLLLNYSTIHRSVLMLMLETEEVDKICPLGEDHLRRGRPFATMTFLFHKFYIAFMFHQYEQMKIAAEQYFSFNLISWSLAYPYAMQSFIGGLVSFWVYRKTNDSLWSDRGHRAKVEMKKWADSSGWNFTSKLHLLEAEEYFSCHDLESAKVSYDNAISAAREYRFINDEALACELTGRFFLAQGKREESISFFLKAHEKYHEWGACAKSSDIFVFVQQNLAWKNG